MVAVLTGIIGLIVGAAIAWSLAGKRSSSQRDAVVKAELELAKSTTELASLKDLLEQTRTQHATALKELDVAFENTSNRVLAETVERFSTSQQQVFDEREKNLDKTLKPLEELLGEYRLNLSAFDEKHARALGELKTGTDALLEEQVRSQSETRRLNQLLGRGDRRGRWGEVQLANVLEASGLHENIDFSLQVSSTTDGGRVQRPDCVVNMPNNTHVAIDAKFPFDAFERSISTEDAEERRAFEQKHARDLREHVKTLRDKRYWEAVSPAPEFVVCFIPSDAAVGVAIDADPELLNFAARERVLIVGPTNLLSLLWSVGMVFRQHQITVNAEEILKLAETIFERIRLVAEPVSRMGRAIDAQVKEYNAMIQSFESRLIVSARNIQSLGGAGHAKEIPTLEPVERLTSRINVTKWGVDGSLPSLESAPTILELDALDE